MNTNKTFRLHAAIKVIILLVSLLFASMIFLYDSELRQGIINGIDTCGRIVIPSLFPFLALTVFITNSGASRLIGKIISPVMNLLFGFKGELATAAFISFFGGYPSGAIGISALYKKRLIEKHQAVRAMYFCVNAGPAFIITAVGATLFGSVEYGMRLFACHITASVIMGLTLRIKNGPCEEVVIKEKPKNENAADCFVDAVTAASKSMFFISAFIILFSGINAVISSLGMPKGISVIVTGLLETVGGCKSAAEAGSPILAAFFLGFGGFSVIFQVLFASAEIKPKFRYFLLSRLIHGFISAVLAAACFYLLPPTPSTLAVISNINSPILQVSAVSIPISVMLIITSALLLFETAKKKKL